MKKLLAIMAALFVCAVVGAFPPPQYSPAYAVEYCTPQQCGNPIWKIYHVMGYVNWDADQSKWAWDVGCVIEGPPNSYYYVEVFLCPDGSADGSDCESVLLIGGHTDSGGHEDTGESSTGHGSTDLSMYLPPCTAGWHWYVKLWNADQTELWDTSVGAVRWTAKPSE